MLKQMTIAVLGVIALSVSSPASAKDCDCEDTKVLRAHLPRTDIRWVDIPPQMVADCRIFDHMAAGHVVMGMCKGEYTRCGGTSGTLPQRCEVLMTVAVIREVTETERVPEVRERVIERIPEVRERIIERERPIVRERTIVRQRHTRHVERDRDSGGSWRPISHRSTMNCWGRGSVPRGEFVYGQCNGKYTRCRGGSLDSGAHRQCWAKH